MKELKAGCDIVTGGVQRIRDLVFQGALSLNALQFIIIDEAVSFSGFTLIVLYQDHFLNDRGHGGGAGLNRLMEQMPLVTSDGGRLQVIVCSATLHNMDISRFAVSYFFT